MGQETPPKPASLITPWPCVTVLPEERPGLPLLLYWRIPRHGGRHLRGVTPWLRRLGAARALRFGAGVGEASYAMLPVNLFMTDHFPADTWAKKVTAPVLAFSGTRDWVVPTRFSRKQMKNFRGEVGSRPGL